MITWNAMADECCKDSAEHNEDFVIEIDSRDFSKLSNAASRGISMFVALAG